MNAASRSFSRSFSDFCPSFNVSAPLRDIPSLCSPANLGFLLRGAVICDVRVAPRDPFGRVSVVLFIVVALS